MKSTRTLALLLAVAPSAVAALDRPVWSEDGSAILGLNALGRRLVAVDGETGAERWSAPLGGGLARRLEWFAPTPDGEGALLVGADELWRAAAGEKGPRRLSRGVELVVGLSPEGSRAAFARAGALWTVELATATETRLADGPVATSPPPAWSPDGRSVAYLTGPGRGAAAAVAVVDLAAPLAARFLALDSGPEREIVAFEWRPDGLAVAVVERSARGEDELTLCNPQKLHCRTLARRAAHVAPDADELVFLDDGFLWSHADRPGEERLAFHDTLGRERRSLGLAGWRPTSIAAVWEVQGQAVVTARRLETPSSPTAWLLIDLHGRRPPRELGSAATDELVVSPAAPRLLRRTAAGGPAAQRIETVEGKSLAELAR